MELAPLALALLLPLAVFETPLLAAGVAGGAVAVPIIIHLLNRRRFRVMQWAAMRFLLAAQRKNSRKMRLEQLLLLLVRCLLVLLLVAAMASVTGWAEAAWRRFFPESVLALAGNSQRAHKVIVLDASYSMGLRDGDSTAFDKAREMAAKFVEDSPRGDAFSVVLMSWPRGEAVVGEPSEDGAKVAAEVRKLKMPHGNADLPATMKTVAGLLQSSPGKFGHREVYFFTDLQRTTWKLNAADILGGALQTFKDRKARTVLVDVGKEGTSNLAVSELTLGEDVALENQTCTLLARLRLYRGTAAVAPGAEPPPEGEGREKVAIRLRVGRLPTAPGEKFDLGEVRTEPVELERGKDTLVAFPYTFPTAGDYVVQVQAPDDALPLDNTRSAVISVRKELPVLLVNGKSTGDPTDQSARYWLRRALRAFGARPKVIDGADFSRITDEELAAYDCVFLTDLKDVTDGMVRRLEGQVRRGGGLVLCLGDQVQPGVYNQMLYRNGTGLMPAPIKGKQEATGEYQFELAVAAGAEKLPPLQRWGGPERESLRDPRFHRFFQLNEPAPGPKPREILTFQPSIIPGKEKAAAKEGVLMPPGGPAVLEWRPPVPGARPPEGAPAGDVARLRGRVVLVTTAVNFDSGNWPATDNYPLLMRDLMLFAAGGRLREQALDVGQPIEFFLNGPGGGLQATLTLPDNRTETLHAQDDGEVGVFRHLETDLSGVYQLKIGGDPRVYGFAVNPPALNNDQQPESDPTRLSPEELKKPYPDWDLQVVNDLGKVDHRPVDAGDRPAEVVYNPLGPRIARWLLLAALVLVFVEVILAWQFGHHSAVATPEEQAAQAARAGGRWGWKGWTLALLPPALWLFLLGLFAVLAHDAFAGDFLGFLPDSTRSGSERVMGIPDPAAGEGRHWRSEYLPYLLGTNSDVWLAALIAVAGILLIGAIYYVEGQRSGLGYRLRLLGLRGGLLLLLLIVLLPQLRLFFERQGYPDVVILLDDSASMSATDSYSDPRVQEAADRLAQVGNLTRPERLRLADALLTRGGNDWLTALLNTRKVRLHVYHCSARAQRLCDVVGTEDVARGKEAIQGLKAEATNDSSQLGASVRQVLNEFRGTSLAAIVMFTDGVTTEGEELSKAAEYARLRGVPLFFVGLGDAHEVRDLYLSDLRCEDSVFVNDNLIFDVQVTGQGYKELTVPVTLREKGSDRVLDRQTVTTRPGTSVKVSLSHRPTEPGEKVYVLETPVQADEVEKDNNRIERQVFVRETKLIKVLYVEGYRRFEYQYIKTLLERESRRIKGNKSIDLRVLLLDADEGYQDQDPSAVGWAPPGKARRPYAFPTKAELAEYDVVILGDVDPRSLEDTKRMTRENLKDLVDFVMNKGGGLLFIAGEHGSPNFYKDTPLAEVLPVEITGPAQPPGAVERTEGYHPELTPVGVGHQILRFSKDAEEQKEIWKHLRELYWYAEGYQAKKAAEVLLVHPRVKIGGAVDRGDREAALVDRHPLMVSQFVGSGRCMFFGFDETWRWGFREDQLRFNEFWIQTIRYLSRSRLGRIDLRLDRQTPYRRGEPIKVTVRFPDDQPPPEKTARIEVKVQRRVPDRPGDVTERILTLTPVGESKLTFEGVLTQTPEGSYRFQLHSPLVNPAPRAECKVLSPPGEMYGLRLNQSELETAAQLSGGRFYNLADAPNLLKDLPSGQRVSLNPSGPPFVLWNHFALFAVALLLLTSEWLLRKERNLL